MNLFKKIFSRRKYELTPNGMPETHEVTLQKIFDCASLVPVEYKFTGKFLNDNYDPFNYEINRLRGLPADWLLKDRRIPAIRADTRYEIEIAKRQHINHLYTIQTINDLQKGMIVHVDEILSRLDEEISAYDDEINCLRSKLNGGN